MPTCARCRDATFRPVREVLIVKAKVTVPEIVAAKRSGRRLTMVTAYDCTFARLIDRAGVDILLVGDSLGMVVQGGESTVPVTLDEMEYHVRLVARAGTRALVLGDLNFGDALPVIMTEKDAVKCAPFADERCWYVPVTAEFPEDQSRALVDLVIARVNAWNATSRSNRNPGHG